MKDRLEYLAAAVLTLVVLGACALLWPVRCLIDWDARREVKE